MCLKADHVPVVTVDNWPHIGCEWVIRGLLWPPLSLVKGIVKRGCHIAPKPYYGQKSNDLLNWRWSFSLAEMVIANARTKKMDLSYLVLKSIFYRYQKSVEYNDETLTFYLIKTVMLWQCKVNNATWWSERNVINCISVLVNRLKKSLYNRHLPHYFVQDINLFDNLAGELILYGQAILESSRTNLGLHNFFIEEVVERLVGESSEKGSKINLKTDIKYNINILVTIAEQ